MKRTNIITAGIILLSFFTGIYLYPMMPEMVASHWNSGGEVDGYLPKFWGLFLMPIISAVLFALFLLIPKIDPLKVNIEKFRNYFDSFILILFLFLFYLYGLTILWNLDARLNMGQVLAPAFAVLLYYSGVLIENSKKNWFIGIRTPWTMSSEIVWEKTHKLGGKLFKTCGAIALLGIIFVGYEFFFILLPVIAITVYITVYSYFEHQKEADSLQKNI